MKDLLEKYIDQKIGINFDRFSKIDPAILSAVNEQYFTITGKHGITYHFPYIGIGHIIEGKNLIKSRIFRSAKRYPIIVKLRPQSIYTWS